MSTLRSGDAQLVYEVTGTGPDVVLLHPFPLHHHFWDGVLEQLVSRYRIVPARFARARRLRMPETDR